MFGCCLWFHARRVDSHVKRIRTTDTAVEYDVGRAIYDLQCAVCGVRCAMRWMDGLLQPVSARDHRRRHRRQCVVSMMSMPCSTSKYRFPSANLELPQANAARSGWLGLGWDGASVRWPGGYQCRDQLVECEKAWRSAGRKSSSSSVGFGQHSLLRTLRDWLRGAGGDGGWSSSKAPSCHLPQAHPSPCESPAAHPACPHGHSRSGRGWAWGGGSRARPIELDEDRRRGVAATARSTGIRFGAEDVSG
jgi:hypothetical protein